MTLSFPEASVGRKVGRKTFWNKGVDGSGGGISTCIHIFLIGAETDWRISPLAFSLYTLATSCANIIKLSGFMFVLCVKLFIESHEHLLYFGELVLSTISPLIQLLSSVFQKNPAWSGIPLNSSIQLIPCSGNNLVFVFQGKPVH